MVIWGKSGPFFGSEMFCDVYLAMGEVYKCGMVRFSGLDRVTLILIKSGFDFAWERESLSGVNSQCTLNRLLAIALNMTFENVATKKLKIVIIKDCNQCLFHRQFKTAYTQEKCILLLPRKDTIYA